MRNAQQGGGEGRETQNKGGWVEKRTAGIFRNPQKEMHNRSGNKETHKKLNTNTYTV